MSEGNDGARMGGGNAHILRRGVADVASHNVQPSLSWLMGHPTVENPSSLMGQPTSADCQNSSGVHGSPDIGSDEFQSRVLKVILGTM